MKILISSQKGVSFEFRVKCSDLVETVARLVHAGVYIRQVELDNPNVKEVSHKAFGALVEANHLIERQRQWEAELQELSLKNFNSSIGGKANHLKQVVSLTLAVLEDLDAASDSHLTAIRSRSNS